MKTIKVNSFYLPGLPNVNPLVPLSNSKKNLKFPAITPQLLETILTNIVSYAQKTLVKCSQKDIIFTIDQVANSWLDPKNKWRCKAIELLVDYTNFSKVIIEHAIDSTFKSLLKNELEMLVLHELGKRPIMDKFCPVMPGRLVRAFGPNLIFHICSGNIPGISVRSLAYGLLVKSANLVKISEGEPFLAPLFAQSIAEVDPELAQAVAVSWWPGGEDNLERVAFDKADHVVVYGSNETIKSVRTRVSHIVKCHFHGHKMGIVIVGKECLTLEKAKDIVKKISFDTVLYNQQGCFSPYLIYVENGGQVTPLDFTKLLAGGMEEMEEKYPSGKISYEIGTQIAQLRTFYRIKDVQDKTAVVLQGEKNSSWTVVLDKDPKPSPSCTHRFLVVKTVEDLSDLAEILAPLKGKISTAGYALIEKRVHSLGADFGRLGAHRFTPVGRMQSPPSHWHHDGRFNLLDFLNFVEIES